MQKILLHPRFRGIIARQAKEIIEFLVGENISFNLLCDVRDIKFEPLLPADMVQSFKEIAMFVITGYTLESIIIENRFLSFEAGFGVENLASVVSIPYTGLIQIILHTKDNEKGLLLFANLSHPYIHNHIPKDEMEALRKSHREGIEYSLAALKSNPENSRFF